MGSYTCTEFICQLQIRVQYDRSTKIKGIDIVSDLIVIVQLTGKHAIKRKLIAVFLVKLVERKGIAVAERAIGAKEHDDGSLFVRIKHFCFASGKS